MTRRPETFSKADGMAEGCAKPWRVGTLSYTTTGLIVLFCWLLWGDFAWSMRDRTVGPVLQLMLKKFSASDTLTGVLLGSLPPAIGMLIGPVVGYLSDHHRGRWGRRIPFLLIPTPVAALAMIGLAFSPALGVIVDHALGPHSPGVNKVTLLFLALFWSLFEMFTTVANSVFGALINDVVPQTVLGIFYGAFRALSLIAGILFNYWLFGEAETEYLWIFLGMGTLYGVGFSVMCFNVREGQYPPPPVSPGRPSVRKFLVAAKGFILECFGIPYYWWLYGMSALSWMSFMPFNLYNVYYAKALDMEMTTYGKCAAITYCISLVLAIPLGYLADLLHPLRLALGVQALFIATACAAGFYVHDVNSFAIVLVAMGVLSGMWMTASASLGMRLLPRSNFAQFGSAGGIIGSLCSIVSAPAVGFFLDRTGHVYRYTLFISSGLAAMALVTGLVLHAKFMARGGPKHYVPIE
jgi:MFS family permease